MHRWIVRLSFPFVSGDSNGYEVFGQKTIAVQYSHLLHIFSIIMNIEKAKQALATLQSEKQEQQDRLWLAEEAKQRLDNRK